VSVCVVTALLAGFAVVTWHQLFRREPQQQFASPEEFFKYGSLSTARGFPLHILRVLPDVFPDKMPGTNGWSSFGMFVEAGQPVPVGWGVRTVGFPGVTFNCALCHSGGYRAGADAKPMLVLGAPAHQLDFGAFLKFLSNCADDPRFEPRTLLASIERTAKLSAVERWTYRLALVPGVKKQLQAARKKMVWMDQRPEAGCGRNDAFNVLKINILGLADDGTIGTADYPPLWNQQARRELPAHWSGTAGRVHEADLVSGLAACGTASAFDATAFSRVTNFIWQLPAPRFPFAIDAALAGQGKVHFDAQCASCHAGGAQFGRVIAAAQAGTDARLAASLSPGLISKINGMKQAPFDFKSWRTTEGYVAAPLDGCWLRGPYLHNGSVPTLGDLLQPAAARPKRFSRGGNLYDAANLGFANDPAVASAPRSLFDTTLSGNSNQGHEYGTSLGDADKRALLEYLKTL